MPLNNNYLVSGIVAGSCITAYSIYCYYSYKNMVKSLHKLAEEENNITNTVLFFGADSLRDCTYHVYKKRMCYKVDCPYRKLRYFLDVLNSCTETLDVCIHLLTSVEIANTLIRVHKRGAKVRIICDNEMSTNKGSQVKNICDNGIEVRIPLLNYHMHSKIAIIDGKTVLTGSVNWTVQGMCGNWDNLVVTSQKNIVKDAIKTFNSIWENPLIVNFQ